MPLKRKIPSRKLSSRKFPTQSKSTGSTASKSTIKQRIKGTTVKRAFGNSLGAKTKTSQASKTKTRGSTAASKEDGQASVQPTVPQCFWDMGFEQLPTMSELRQRYKELSLVLHPDAGGNKQSFLALRTNYESAQAILIKSTQK